MSLAAVLVVMIVTSALPAATIADGLWLAVGLTPLLFAAVAALSGFVATLFQVSVLIVFMPAVTAVNALAIRCLWRRPWARRLRAQFFSGAVIAFACAYGLLPLKAPLLDFDTRTHWFGPARWYFGGGSYVWHALTNPASGGHRDYPPLIAATVGTMWRLQGHVDLRSGQLTVSLLNFGALLLVGLALPRLFPRLGIVPTVAGVCVVLSGYGFAGRVANDGYADLLWSACATAAVVCVLLAPAEPVNLVIGSIALVVAGLTKNEGMVGAVAVGLLACWRFRGRLRTVPQLVAGIPIVLAWPVFVRLRGVHGDLQGGDVSAFLRGDSRIWDRIVPTTRAIAHQSIGVVVAALICTVLGLLVARGARRAAGIGTTGWAWAAALVIFVAMAAAYVIASDNLEHHLATSVGRTTIALRLLLITETCIWALCGLSVLGRPASTRPRRSDERERVRDLSADIIAVPVSGQYIEVKRRGVLGIVRAMLRSHVEGTELQ